MGITARAGTRSSPTDFTVAESRWIRRTRGGMGSTGRRPEVRLPKRASEASVQILNGSNRGRVSVQEKGRRSGSARGMLLLPHTRCWILHTVCLPLQRRRSPARLFALRQVTWLQLRVFRSIHCKVPLPGALAMNGHDELPVSGRLFHCQRKT